MWPGAANATVDFIDTLRDFVFGSLAGDADLAGTATIPSNDNSKTVAGGAFDFGGTVISGSLGSGAQGAVLTTASLFRVV